MPYNAQGLLLALHSGINPDGSWGNIDGSEGGTHVSHK